MGCVWIGLGYVWLGYIWLDRERSYLKDVYQIIKTRCNNTESKSSRDLLERNEISILTLLYENRVGRELYRDWCNLDNWTGIAWFWLAIWELRGIRGGVEKEKCPLWKEEENVIHTSL